MKIDINANSLRKLVRLLRNLADELEKVCDFEKSKKEVKKEQSTILKLVESKKSDNSDTCEVLRYYKEIHSERGRAIGPKHAHYRLIKQRLAQGYTVEELKTAILENSREEFWVKRGLHGIDHIMKKDSNLDGFIQKKSKGGKNGESGYSSGSTEFNSDYKGFGD